MKLIKSLPIGGAEFIADVDPDLYDTFMLRVSGTQAAGSFCAIGEVGTVVYKHGGTDIVNADFDLIHFINEVQGGDVECTGEANGAAFAFSCFIERGFRDGNVEAVEITDKAQIKLKYGVNMTPGGQIASGVCELYGEPKVLGIEHYRLKYIEFDADVSAGTKYRMNIAEDNVIALYFDRGFGKNNGTAKASLTVDADFTEIVVEKDNKTFHSIPVAAAQAMSNYRNKLESAYVRCFELMLATEGKLSEALSDAVIVQYGTTGAALIRCVAVCADFQDDKQVRTAQASNDVRGAILARKAAANKVKTLNVLANVENS